MASDTGAAKGELCGVCGSPMIETTSTCQACGAERRLKGGGLRLLSIPCVLVAAWLLHGSTVGLIESWTIMDSLRTGGLVFFAAAFGVGIVALLVAAFWLKAPLTPYYVKHDLPRQPDQEA